MLADHISFLVPPRASVYSHCCYCSDSADNGYNKSNIVWIAVLLVPTFCIIGLETYLIEISKET